MKGIQVALIGSLTREPDPIRETATGKKYRAFNLGVFDGTEPEWVKVTAWGDDLDRFDGLKKGAEVYVEGRRATANTNPRTKTETRTRPCAVWLRGGPT